jgi:hypothetical protein
VFVHGLAVSTLQQSREPSSLRELHVCLCRQTASATATGLADLTRSNCQQADNVETYASTARCKHRGRLVCVNFQKEVAAHFAPLQARARSLWLRTDHNALRQLASRRVAASGCQSHEPRRVMRLSSGHSDETSTISQKRVFRSFP